jgi:hypothetical protein
MSSREPDIPPYFISIYLSIYISTFVQHNTAVSTKVVKLNKI